MKILVSGGGLAGLTLGYWLHRAGFTPVIIERASHVRHSGYGIDFFGTGYEVAERMGLIDWLAARKIPAQYVAYVEKSGKEIARLPIELMEKVMYGKYMALMHGTLEEGLYQAVGDQFEIRFGCSLAGVEVLPDAVRASFEGGDTEDFDLLIGADGIHSNTRSLVFGPEAQFGRFLGYQVASYPVPDRYGIGQSWQNYTEPKRQVGAYVSDQPGEIITFFMYETVEDQVLPPEQRLPQLRRAFAGMGWLAEALLAAAPASDEIFMDTVTQIEMSSWHRGRVALVGDAAYCLTLISGQGASMAMGGAYLLAQALAHNSDVETAFQQYENQMRPEIISRQKSARDFAKAFVPGSQIGLFLQKIMMKVILRPAFTGLLRKQFGAGSILDHIEHER